ncbi:MAG: DNA methyltransferase, partial [Alphaproteobacteria bacterium]|nr:DNA methyltransferase [Alphaproteobacteria bacterium]
MTRVASTCLVNSKQSGHAKKLKRPKSRKHSKATCHIERQDFAVFMNGLDKGSVDLILTDPPYTISRKTGFSKVKNGVQRFAVSMEFGKWDTKQIDLSKMATAMYRVLRTGGTAIIWYDIWKLSHLAESMAEAGFKMLRVLIWQKTNPVPLNMKTTYLSNSREIAIVGVKSGKPTFHGNYDNGIYEYPIPRHNCVKLHPTQKPLDLFCELIEKH